MGSPRAAVELAAIALLPAVTARLREEATLAPALEPLRENIRAVRAAGVLVEHDGTIVPDLERVAALAPAVRKRLSETGRMAAEALTDAWTKGAPLAEIMLPAVARACGFSLLRHEPVVRRAMLQAEPGTLFVFGDNMRRAGMGGQAAEMRGEPNAVGIPTKIAPSMAPDAFFTDADLPKALEVFAQEFGRLEAHLRAGGKIVVPEAGIGGGRAQLSQRAPKIHEVLTRAMDALDREAAGDQGAHSVLAVFEEARQALGATTKAVFPAVAAPTSLGGPTYAGIGSRKTPPAELARMEAVGAILQRQGWTLRSGGADGADSAFERGADRASREDGTAAHKEIYIPWSGRDVARFAGPDRIGSNMYAAPVRWGDAVTPEREWPCNELPYLVAKTLDPAQRAEMIRRFDGAAAAAAANGKSHADAVEIGARTVKKASRGLTLRPDWDNAKLDVMRALVADKARRNPEVGDWLIATGNGLIQEGNTWGDVFWGVALADMPSRGIRAGQGENHLGRIWMETRDLLRKERGLPPLPPREQIPPAKTATVQGKPAARPAEPEFF